MCVEIKKKYDYLDVNKIKCGIYVPFDGVVLDRKGEEDKLEKHARSKGIKFFDEFILKKVHVDNDTVSHVEVIVC